MPKSQVITNSMNTHINLSLNHQIETTLPFTERKIVQHRTLNLDILSNDDDILIDEAKAQVIRLY